VEALQQSMLALEHPAEAQHQPAEKIEGEFLFANAVEVLDQQAVPADVHASTLGIGGVEVRWQTKAVAYVLRGGPGGQLLLTSLPLPAQLLADVGDLQIAGVDLHRPIGKL